MATIVVYVEHQGGAARRASLEALGAAHAAGGEVVAALCGPGAGAAGKGLGAHGAARIVAVRGPEAHSPDAVAGALAQVVTSLEARAFLAAATSTGRDVAPRVAAHLDSN